MKNKYITLLSVLVIGATAPLTVVADTIDNQINDASSKIESLKGQKEVAEAALAQINLEVSDLETQVKTTLDKKVALEKELNKLNNDIASLVQAIEKRTEKITDQARSTQVNQSKNRFLDVILDSENFSDAISRSWAYGKLVSANNEIVTAQKEDKEELEKKKTDLDTKMAEVTELTAQLKVKQEEMTTKQYDQAILAKEVEASLTSEETKKEGLLQEKKEAEKRKAEAERLAKEKAEKEAAVQKEAENQRQAALVAKTDKEIAEEIGNINVQVMPDDKENQGNGGNKPQTGSGDFQWPLPSISITSGFGGRVDPTGNAGNYHSGLDMAGSLNDNVYASRAGTVVASGFEPGGGNHIIIQHDNGYYTYYLHLNQRVATQGQQVNAGDVVGLMGTTGDSTGVHLHFGVSTGFWSGYLDPGPFLGLY